MSWAGRRRALYGGGVLLFFLVAVGVPAFLFFYDAPTCFDGVQNQGEVAIDRGGLCHFLADSQVQREAVLWARSLLVTDGVYNAVAYIDNPNFDAGVSQATYSFKLFDENNILVAERKGSTYISPNGTTPIFEGGIQAGERVPVRTFFSFLEPLLWERVSQDRSAVIVGERGVSNEVVAPRIDATIVNQSFEDLFDVDVVVTVFDSDGTAMASSQTLIKILPQQEDETVVFTWPTPFPRPISRIEIIPRTPFDK